MTGFALSPVMQNEGAAERRMRRLHAFHPQHRQNIERLTESSRKAEDLADTFPGLLFAMATGFGTSEQRAHAFLVVESGGSLRAASDTLGIPWWMRRLPPQAYADPLVSLPMDESFSRHIVHLVPTGPLEARVWLWGILYGYRACSADFALWAATWLARHHRILTAPQGENTFRYMTAWAWYGGFPNTDGHRIMRKQWSKAMGLRRAVDELGNWRRRIALTYAIANVPDGDWIREGHALGFDFVRLKSPRDFIEESDMMDNCLDQFADRLQQHRSHVFSIRRNGRSLANVEIGGHEQEQSMPSLLQLRGPRNKRANAELWQAAYAWLGQQDVRQRNTFATLSKGSPARDAAKLFWAPYLTELKPTGLDGAFRDLVLGPQGAEKHARRGNSRTSRHPHPSSSRSSPQPTSHSGAGSRRDPGK